MRMSDWSSDVCSSALRVGVAVTGDDLRARREHRTGVAASTEGRVDMALVQGDGERGEDLVAEDRIVAGIAGKLAHLRPFPLVSAQLAARRRSTGSASAQSARAGSHQTSKPRSSAERGVA